MWLRNYIKCVIRKHLFTAITVRQSSYRYCLRCGKLETEENNQISYKGELS